MIGSLYGHFKTNVQLIKYNGHISTKIALIRKGTFTSDCVMTLLPTMSRPGCTVRVMMQQAL